MADPPGSQARIAPPTSDISAHEVNINARDTDVRDFLIWSISASLVRFHCLRIAYGRPKCKCNAAEIARLCTHILSTCHANRDRNRPQPLCYESE